MNKKNVNVKRVELEYEYNHSITFRKSAFTKTAWETIVHKFSITQFEPNKIMSITIEGEDDYGRLILSVIVEV